MLAFGDGQFVACVRMRAGGRAAPAAQAPGRAVSDPDGTVARQATANSHAVIWGNGTSLQGAYLPSLKRFTIDTTVLDRLVTSEYCCGPNLYSAYLTSRTLYVIASAYAPQCDPTHDCPAPLPQLYEAPSPRETKRNVDRRRLAGLRPRSTLA